MRILGRGSGSVNPYQAAEKPTPPVASGIVPDTIFLVTHQLRQGSARVAHHQRRRHGQHQVQGKAELLDDPAMHVEHAARAYRDRQTVVKGKSVTGSVELGGQVNNKKNNERTYIIQINNTLD